MVDLNELKLKMEIEQSSYYVINSDIVIYFELLENDIYYMEITRVDNDSWDRIISCDMNINDITESFVKRFVKKGYQTFKRIR